MKIKTATGPIFWYMKRCDFKGWASFWHGYWRNPYEVEARAAELSPPRPPTP